MKMLTKTNNNFFYAALCPTEIEFTTIFKTISLIIFLFIKNVQKPFLCFSWSNTKTRQKKQKKI